MSNEIERERCNSVNIGLDPLAFELAWNAFQNTPIDFVADSDDEACRCVYNAIAAYIVATSPSVPQRDRENIYRAIESNVRSEPDKHFIGRRYLVGVNDAVDAILALSDERST